MEHTAGGREVVTQQQKPCLGAQGMQSPRVPRRKPPGVRVLGAAQHKLSTKRKSGRTQQAGRPIRRLCTPPKTVSSPNSAGHLGSPQITLPFRAAKMSPGGR